MSKYIMYLRKSRQDDPQETVEEVLVKHETQLQEYAEKELGGRIPEGNIYREVVSGESIDDREEVQKVLLRIEDPSIAGVLVIEPQRLSRGDLEDCGRLINDLRYTNTQVVTPMMTYDLTRKMERKFFQDELLRGRDYLEYTKEILLRGRIAAVKRGCYIGNYAPFGFDKVKLGKDHTLEPNSEADVVRMIFDLYTREQLTPYRIACRLNELGIPAPRGEKWVKDTIRGMVKNQHYIGKVVFNKIKETTVIENGERKVKRLAQPEEEVIVAEGKHPAIISMETWERAQELVARNPKLKYTYDLRNPLSGILCCKKCGRAMSIHPYKHAEDRFECKTKPRCFKSVRVSELLNAVITVLETVELPALEAKAKTDDGDARKIQERLLATLEKQMKEYREQEETQYELLETKKYTQELFDRRNSALREKMDACQEQIFKAKSSLPKSVNYEERALTLKAAIASLRNDAATPAEKNRLLKSILDRIEYTGTPSLGTDRKGKPKGENTFTLNVFLRL
ncbi:MAG: recombinase family protein [Oscillospiraceae bacterium]|nr:recombinase family protein [Oscillospiraceae bacterium]